MFFYTYMHVDPRTDDVRYVGVGSLKRGYDFQSRSGPHLAWIAELELSGYEPRVALLCRTKDREEAHEVEKQLIKWHRERGSVLFNVSGGPGTTGVAMTDARKQQISAVHKAKWLFDPTFRERRLPDMAKARAAINRTPEHIAKVTKHAKVTGAPCRKCGGQLRYATGRNCVQCAKKTS